MCVSNQIPGYGGICIKFTVLDRIILHLYPYRKFQSEGLLPEPITQLGIASAVGISYSHVPRAVKSLQEQGLIVEVMAHIDDQPTSRRRKAYFLTDQGLKIASKLQSTLADFQVVFRDRNGVTTKKKLKDINKLLKSSEDLFSLYNILDPDLVLDVYTWEKNKERIQSKTITKRISSLGVDSQSKKIDLVEAKKLLGSEFSRAETEAIYHHTEGNLDVIKKIMELKKIKYEELKDLSQEERALTLCIMARAELEKDAV